MSLRVQFPMSLSGTTKWLEQIDSTLYTTILDSQKALETP